MTWQRFLWLKAQRLDSASPHPKEFSLGRKGHTRASAPSAREGSAAPTMPGQAATQADLVATAGCLARLVPCARPWQGTSACTRQRDLLVACMRLHLACRMCGAGVQEEVSHPGCWQHAQSDATAITAVVMAMTNM